MYGQQMSMFQEGGVALEDEGGEVEETSGNEVPLGGIKEGVADDQPAQLSPGEMILSEDVVRYHGVEKIMALRDEAKIGYHKMEAMGQLGNADEATIPTEAIFNPGGMPFSVVDLEYIEMGDDDDEAEVMAMADNEDEPIKAQAGTLVPVQQPAASFSRINPTTGLPEITTAPATLVPQVLQPGTPAPITTGSTLTPTTLSSLTPTSTPISAPDRPAGPQQPAPQQLPSATQFLGGVSGTNFFINEIGQVIQIPVVNGRQIFDEPEGFQPYDPSNPQPFDPDLEEDTVTDDEEQPPQRRRTVTEREEGGQPDVGPGGFDTPGFGAPTGETGIGLGSLGAVNAAVDAINELENPDIEQINSVLDANQVTIGDIGKFGTTVPATGILGALISAAANAVTSKDRQEASLAITEAVATAREEGTRDRSKSRPGIRGFSPAPGVPGGPAGSVDTAAAVAEAAEAMGSMFDAPTDTSGQDSGSDSSDAGGDTGAGPDTGGGDFGGDPTGAAPDTGEGEGTPWNTGGLISPRLHRKRMKKNNRKGLVAPK